MAKDWKSVSINLETYDLLKRQAERNYRTISGQIRLLAEKEEAAQVPELVERKRERNDGQH